MPKEPDNSALQHKVIFFRGLNTHGSDSLRLGPLSFGSMARPLSKQFRKMGVDLLVIEKMQSGFIQAQVNRALQWLEDQHDWQDPMNRFHVLGHSTGGLIARVFVHQIPDPTRIISVTTMATPHQGADMALGAWDYHLRHPLSGRSNKALGDETSNKLDSFQDLNSTSLKAFNDRYLDLKPIQYGSCLFSIPEDQMSWPVRLVHRRGRRTDQNLDSDGFVEKASQRWGKVITEMPLDHLTQIGFNFYAWPPQRWEVHRQFRSLCEALKQHWQDIEKRIG